MGGQKARKTALGRSWKSHAPGHTGSSPRCPCIWRRTRRTSCAAGSCSPATPGGDPPFRRTRRPRLSAGWKPWLPTRRRGTPSEQRMVVALGFSSRSKIVIFYGRSPCRVSGDFHHHPRSRGYSSSRGRCKACAKRSAAERSPPRSRRRRKVRIDPPLAPRSAARPASAPRGLGITTPRR